MLAHPGKTRIGGGLRPMLPPAPTSKPPLQPDRLLTPAEAAQLLGVGERTLERWRMTGDGPAYAKLTSKTVRYQREDVAAFVSASVRKNTAT